jgi:hypothetical protein
MSVRNRVTPSVTSVCATRICVCASVCDGVCWCDAVLGDGMCCTLRRRVYAVLGDGVCCTLRRRVYAVLGDGVCVYVRTNSS